jgi:hypothetical protein
VEDDNNFEVTLYQILYNETKDKQHVAVAITIKLISFCVLPAVVVV